MVNLKFIGVFPPFFGPVFWVCSCVFLIAKIVELLEFGGFSDFSLHN